MVTSGTRTVATFTGKLLQRQRLAGKPIVQLVFREAGKDWLCLSSNLANVKLQIGKEYRIEGLLRSLGERPYIHDPQIVLAHGRLWRLKRVGFSTAVVLVVATMTAFAVRSVHGSLAPTSAETTKTPHTSTAANTTPAPVVPANTVLSTSKDTPAPTTPTPKTTKKATTPAPTTPPPADPGSTTPVVINPPVLAPHCDDPVTTPFSTVFVADPALVQTGVDHIERTCYPDVGTANGYIDVQQAGQPAMVLQAPPADLPQ